MNEGRYGLGWPGMMASWIKIPALFILLRWGLLAPTATISGCANMVAPTGGPRDSIPPQLIKAEPAGYSTSFGGDRLKLYFNEFIRIQNRSAVRLIPEPEKQPIIRDVLNSVEVDFNHIKLEPSTTYALYMGDALVDFTEGNKLKDFKHVFSTGRAIDSGWISGHVLDMVPARTKVQSRVALYDWVEAADSVVYKKKARYWTTADDSGRFHLGFLPDRDFRMFVWVDDNKDALYAGGEAFDFVELPVRPKQGSYDSSCTHELRLSVDRDEQARILNYTEKWPGWLGITFSTRPSEVKWMIGGGLFQESGAHEPHFWRGDTAYVFVGDTYKNAELGGVVAIAQMIHRTDTVVRKATPVAIEVKKPDAVLNRLPEFRSLMGGTPELQAGKGYLSLTTDLPLERVDSAAFIWVDTLSKNTVHTGANYRIKEGIFRIGIPGSLKQGGTYRLIIPRASVVGGGGQILDSFVQVFKVVNDSKVKKISIIANKKQEEIQEKRRWTWPGSVLELVDATGLICGVYRFTEADSGQWDHGQDVLELLPGTYSISLYTDENGNGKHDAASWRLNRRAEPLRSAQWIVAESDRRELKFDPGEWLWK